MIEDFWKTRRLKFSPIKMMPIRVKGFGLVPRKDSDFDGVPDIQDCRPHNPLRQDLSDYEQAEMLTRLSDELEKPEEPTEKQHKSIYVFDGKRWYFTGTYEVDKDFDVLMEQYRSEFQQVVADDNPNLENYLNRQELKEKFQRGSEAVSKYAERQQFTKNIKKGLQIKKVPIIKRTATLRIRGFQGERRLTPEEKLSPNFQQKSVFPQTCPYRPISVQQAIPRLPLISSPFIQRVREGRPYETIKQPQFFPPFLGNQMFRPRFLGRRAINEEEVREFE